MKKTKTKSRKADTTQEDAAVSQAVDSAVQPDEADTPGEAAESGADAAQLDEKGASIEQLEAKVVSLEDSLLRAKADCQNLQRRSAIDRAEGIRYANAELMKSLLSVVDDFERSLEAAKTSENHDALIDGARLVYENLIKALSAHGLERIKALHQAFDPHVHEAMMQQPSADFSPGTVIEEVTRGYQLRDRVLRPARVVVSAAQEAKQGGTSEEPEGDSQEKEES